LRFWDSSALITLHVAQANTAATRNLYAEDPDVLAWALTEVEMRSALRRLERKGALTGSALTTAMARVDALWRSVHRVQLTDAVKARAMRLLATHPLHAADALQLAAALVAAEDEPVGHEFVCLDVRLATAAAREGFTVHPAPDAAPTGLS
jgi:predicted nucleic acid-binding protein